MPLDLRLVGQLIGLIAFLAPTSNTRGSPYKGFLNHCGTPEDLKKRTSILLANNRIAHRGDGRYLFYVQGAVVIAFTIHNTAPLTVTNKE